MEKRKKPIPEPWGEAKREHHIVVEINTGKWTTEAYFHRSEEAKALEYLAKKKERNNDFQYRMLYRAFTPQELLKVRLYNDVVNVPETVEYETYREREKVQALAKRLEIEEPEAYTLYKDGDWLVYTDSEADYQAKEYIIESLWAFNANFLASMTGLPEECFAALSQQYESANDPILQIVKQTCGLDPLVKRAIREDGRGHFLSHYDGYEIEQNFGGETYYLYRCN